MEEDAKQFLLRVVRSLTAALLWLLINMTLGIYLGLLLFKNSPSTGNIIFYIWFILSIGLLIRYLIKVWWPKNNDLTGG
jgi:membrane protein DedA with SNARE-associated domain